MFQWLRQWRQNRIVQQSPVRDDEWQKAFQMLPVLHRLNLEETARLKRLAILFLHYKSIEAVSYLQITLMMRLVIALQACLPVLNLGLDWYDGWISVIVYPGAFSKLDREVDEFGIEHTGRSNLSGESWQRGPVILSWDDSLHNSGSSGRNVVIHEFAHKLDMRNGRANGFPPLHKGMSVQHWSEVFNKAYADFEMHIQQDEPLPIDQYAATSPGEFFAVFSELFFEKPSIINAYYPDVYEQLVQFYRQNTLSRLSSPVWPLLNK